MQRKKYRRMPECVKREAARKRAEKREKEIDETLKEIAMSELDPLHKVSCTHKAQLQVISLFTSGLTDEEIYDAFGKSVRKDDIAFLRREWEDACVDIEKYEQQSETITKLLKYKTRSQIYERVEQGEISNRDLIALDKQLGEDLNLMAGKPNKISASISIQAKSKDDLKNMLKKNEEKVIDVSADSG